MKKNLVILILCCVGLFSKKVAAQEVFTWQDCVREAGRNHPDLISAQEVINQEKAGKNIAASGLYPQINSSLGASTSETDSGTKTTGTDTYSYGMTGSQLLFDAGKTINNVEAASANIKAAQESYRFISAAVRLRLRSAFINLFKAQEEFRIAGEIYKIRKENFELITLRYESGLEHKGAFLTAEANLAQAKIDMFEAKRDIRVSQRQLAKEMGRIQLTSIEAKGDFQIRETIMGDPDFEALADNNPVLAQRISQVNVAELGVSSAFADFFPEISGQAGIGRTDSHWPPQSQQWNAGLSVALPIFEGGARIAEVSQAKALLKEAQANRQSSKDSIIFDLEQAWAEFQTAVENVEVQNELLIATEERYKIAQAQYSTGFISFDNWTIIENNLVQAKKNFLTGQANALLTEANWIYAKGETLEYAQ